MKTNEELEARVERLERLIANMAAIVRSGKHAPYSTPESNAALALSWLARAIESEQPPTDDEEE